MIPITGIVKVVDYDPNWPAMFEEEAAKIKQALGTNCTSIHHVGSTSILGLSAKPIIDIICGVNQLTRVKIKEFEALNFKFLDEYGIPMRMFFIKRTGTEVNLHIYEQDNSEIELNLLLRDYLRNDTLACKKYANLKRQLIKNGAINQKNTSTFSEYTLGKNELIREFLKESGFSRCRIMHCSHYDEWEAYHRINESQIFKPIGVKYDKNHPTLQMENHFHFVLYKGTEIVSIAHVEYINNMEAAIRSLATDKIYQRHGFAKVLIQLIERWLKYHDKNTIRLHASLKSEGFYRKLGYTDMPFNDQPLTNKVIDLGKTL